MKKIIFVLLIGFLIFSNCSSEDKKQYYVHYKISDNSKPIKVFFYGKEDSYFIHFENNMNQYKLVVVDTLTHKRYYFNSNLPIKIEYTNIKIEENYNNGEKN